LIHNSALREGLTDEVHRLRSPLLLALVLCALKASQWQPHLTQGGAKTQGDLRTLARLVECDSEGASGRNEFEMGQVLQACI
jgi:hypothetical protein